jgi:hypothetical protein
MGGGLMQLVAYGAQDIYLTGNPQITFFKVVYRRHTNFSMEAIEQTLNGTVGLGSSTTATISRNGDLVGRMYIEFIPSAWTKGNVACANLGSALVKEVEIEIGGQRIDKHYGHWMETWSELTEVNPGHVTGLQAADLTEGTTFQNLSCSGGVFGATTAITDPMWVPLQFWFNRNPGLALPLIALQYHEVKVKVTLESAGASGIGVDMDLKSNAMKLWADYIYLDTDERRRFAQVSHEYLIEQLQFQSFSGTPSNMELNFNHPVKELIWTGVPNTSTGVSAGPSTPTTVQGTLSKYHLKLNGHDRMAAREAEYFTRCQVWQHHSGFGGITADADGGAEDSIAVYSFALKPEEHQPSGTCNFSRIDNAQLVVGGIGVTAYNVYAVNYNVLRIMSGMGGLAYSN